MAVATCGLLVLCFIAWSGLLPLLTGREGGRPKRVVARRRLDDLRVLVVEDSFLFRQVIRKALGQRRAKSVVMAVDGLQGLEFIKDAAARGRPFELMFFDWNMPRASGLDVITHLRGQRLYDKTPIFMISAETHAANVKEALRAGVTGYVMKPISAEKLADRVQEALQLIEQGFTYQRRKPRKRV